MWEGHSGRVSTATFSPDRKTVASASDDKTVQLWDVATGSSRHELVGHSGWVSTATFSPDGKTVASASHDKTVRLWDVATGSSRHELVGHLHWVSTATFSPDGKTVASASHDQTVRLWDCMSGKYLSTFETGYTKTLEFSSNGCRLKTDQGELRIVTLDDSEFDGNEVSWNRPMSSNHGWLRLGADTAVWIPPKYRFVCSATHRDVVVLGHLSGAVTILRYKDIDDL